MIISIILYPAGKHFPNSDHVAGVHSYHGPYSVIRSAKFITREKWFAIGDGNGWVHVYADPTEEKIKEFKAHRGESVSL